VSDKYISALRRRNRAYNKRSVRCNSRRAAKQREARILARVYREHPELKPVPWLRRLLRWLM